MIIYFTDDTDKEMWCSLLNIDDIDEIGNSIELDETDPMTRSLCNWNDEEEE